jgi:hypothetical protein
MTHAPRGGRRLFPATLFDGDSTVGAMGVRDYLANNAMHAADEAGAKVLVNWTAPDSSLITGTPQTYLTGDLETTNVWYRIESYGPFGLSVFADGTPYQIVAEVYAAASAASACDIAIQIAPSIIETPTEIVFGTGRDSQQWTTSSTSVAWLTSVSGSNRILPTSAAFLARERVTTDVFAGDPVGVVQCEFFVNVYGRGTSGVAEPRIHGLHVREYVGK